MSLKQIAAVGFALGFLALMLAQELASHRHLFSGAASQAPSAAYAVNGR